MWKAKLGASLVGAALIAVIGILVWREISVWGECLSNNSFMFCWRLLG